MEWGHRVLGRLIGIGFVVPLAYFALRKRLTATLPRHLFGMALLIGAQGALGWYMVKSGLEDSLMGTPGAVPRVSQYRLAAHLGTAFVLYAGMFYTGLATIADWRYANKGLWSGLKEDSAKWKEILANPNVKKFARNVKGLTALVFLTALSGAASRAVSSVRILTDFSLVQVHSSLVSMLVCCTTSSRSWVAVLLLLRMSFSILHTRRVLIGQTSGGATSWRTLRRCNSTIAAWYVLAARNLKVHPRLTFSRQAITTYIAAAALYVSARNPVLRAALPPLTRKMATGAFAMANVQVLLGISTLLYLVPISLAAMHQAGSVMLLTTMMHLLLSLRRPGVAAQTWRQAFRNAQKTATRH